MYAIAITDRTWFDYQRSHGFIDEVNFWTPSKNGPSRLSKGDFFVFKLKGPGDLIGGYGTFLEYKFQSLEDTWKEFGRKNGADNKEDFLDTLKSFDSNNGTDCGSVVLKDVVYFDDPVDRIGAGITKKPAQLYAYEDTAPFPFDDILVSSGNFSLVPNTEKRKTLQSVTDRVGQGAFHTAVSRAYKGKCCITGETAPELLQAAHIQDYINKDSNHIQNGLLLRIDIHKLFDSGLLYIDNHYKVHVSSLVESDDYDKYNDKEITLPDDEAQYPSKKALKFKEDSFRK